MSWPELVDATGPIRAMLEISRSTWADAVNAIGEADTAAAIAAILPRSGSFRSSGGHLHCLPE